MFREVKVYTDWGRIVLNDISKVFTSTPVESTTGLAHILCIALSAGNEVDNIRSQASNVLLDGMELVGGSGPEQESCTGRRVRNDAGVRLGRRISFTNIEANRRMTLCRQGG